MVPATAHFIWFGRKFWWTNTFAIRSAAERGAFERVVLHHDQDLDDAPAFQALSRVPTFEARRLVPSALFDALGELGAPLGRLFESLEKPNARANVVRAAILASQGGVYLDIDTITVKSFAPLLVDACFCGEERVVLPAVALRNRSPQRIAKSWALMGLREAGRLAPDGWRWFRRVEDLYPLAVNNAVVGAMPDHPLIWSLLRAMVDVPSERRLVPYALGTHLLQDQVAGYTGDDLVVHPPPVFFPLGPEVSHHWFRLRRRPVPLAEVLQPSTRLVHWYASVRTRGIVPQIDGDYVRAHAEQQLFSALALPFV